MLDSIRGWLFEHGPASAVIAIAALTVALGLTARSCESRAQPAPVHPTAWYYDLNTRELFLADENQPAPIETASGQHRLPDGSVISAGVRAHVFACGDCNDPANRFVGYLERYAPDVHAQLTNRAAATSDGSAVTNYYTDPDIVTREGRLICGVDDGVWVPLDSPEGRALIERVSSRCGADQRPRPCLPPRK